MRLERLEISGFCHFEQSLIMDLRDAAGLIAIVGPNGSGKTTGLDAALACLYGPGVQNKAFPSRDGTLFTYATSREAYIDTLWYLEGRGRIHCRVNVDGPRRKADAVLEEIAPDGTAYPVNNGLVATYRDAVTERFPSLRSLLASAYAAQNRRGSFGDLGQKERLELFTELADLSHLEEKSQIAKRCQQIAESIASRLQSALDVLRRDATVELLESLRSERAETDRSIALGRGLLDGELARIDELTSESSRLSAEAHLYTAALARRDGLQRAVAQAKTAIADHDQQTAQIPHVLKEAVRRAIEIRDTALVGIKRRRHAATIAHEAKLKDLRERISNNRTLLTDATNIRSAVQRVQDIDVTIRHNRARIDALCAIVDEAIKHVKAAQIEMIKAQSATRELTMMRARTEMLSTIKFGADCMTTPACPLVTDALQARDRVADLEVIASSLDSWTASVRDAEALAAEQRTNIAAINVEIATIQIERDQLARKAALAAHLDVAEGRIAEYERDIIAAEKAQHDALRTFDTDIADAIATQVKADTAAKESAKQQNADAWTRRLALVEVLAARSDELTTVDADVASRADVKRQQDDVLNRLHTAQVAASDLKTQLARGDVEREHLSCRIAQIEQRLVQSSELERRLRIVEDEGLAWQILARACGRDGLQRLEIDAAGPSVSDLANELLRVGYGTRFSVDIVTQVANAKKDDVKEKFTILAIDNEHGGEARDIGDLSGGERVVVEEAVRAALSCYVNLRSRQPSRTIWRDETTGALDPENAPRYVAMLRKLQELSGAQQVLFITHSQQCAALADAQIRVRDGRATLALPPYEEAA